VDEYASATAFVTTAIGSVTFASAGTHVLRVACTGNNPASTGFLLSADKFTFAGRVTGTIALGNLNQNYDGSPRSVSATTTPAGLRILITYDGNWSTPTAAGAYSVIARIIDATYVGTTSGTLVVAPAPATVTVAKLRLKPPSHTAGGTANLRY
jgi:hypothetical protein